MSDEIDWTGRILAGDDVMVKGIDTVHRVLETGAPHRRPDERSAKLDDGIWYPQKMLTMVNPERLILAGSRTGKTMPSIIGLHGPAFVQTEDGIKIAAKIRTITAEQVEEEYGLPTGATQRPADEPAVYTSFSTEMPSLSLGEGQPELWEGLSSLRGNIADQMAEAMGKALYAEMDGTAPKREFLSVEEAERRLSESSGKQVHIEYDRDAVRQRDLLLAAWRKLAKQSGMDEVMELMRSFDEPEDEDYD